MAYIERTKYTIVDDDFLKEELLDILYEKDDLSSTKARQLVYYPVPMSLIRWGKYLTPAQVSRYLVAVDNNGSTISNIDEDIADMGI